MEIRSLKNAVQTRKEMKDYNGPAGFPLELDNGEVIQVTIESNPGNTWLCREVSGRGRRVLLRLGEPTDQVQIT